MRHIVTPQERQAAQGLEARLDICVESSGIHPVFRDVISQETGHGGIHAGLFKHNKAGMFWFINQLPRWQREHVLSVGRKHGNAMKRYYTHIKAQQAKRLAGQGWKRWEIAKLFNVTEGTISKWVNRVVVNIRKPAPPRPLQKLFAWLNRTSAEHQRRWRNAQRAQGKRAWEREESKLAYESMKESIEARGLVPRITSVGQGFIDAVMKKGRSTNAYDKAIPGGKQDGQERGLPNAQESYLLTGTEK